jgi:hypothetical protein
MSVAQGIDSCASGTAFLLKLRRHSRNFGLRFACCAKVISIDVRFVVGVQRLCRDELGRCCKGDLEVREGGEATIVALGK